jgi:dihydroneopterin aldolase
MKVDDTFISVDGLRVYGYHGVLPIEQKVGNTFEVSLELRYNAELAMQTDNIERALNYANVVEDVVELMKIPQQLLEHIAAKIAETLDDNYPAIIEGKIRITKVKPPISADLDSVSFTLAWTNNTQN